MAMTEEARHELHEALRTKIGPSPAVTLMGALLLKDDLDRFEERLTQRFEHLQQMTTQRIEMAEYKLQAEFTGKLNTVWKNLFFTILMSQATLVGMVLAAVRL